MHQLSLESQFVYYKFNYMVYKHYSNKYVKNFKNHIDYKTKNKIFTHYNIIYKNINLNSNFKQNFFNYGVLKFFKNYHKYKT